MRHREKRRIYLMVVASVQHWQLLLYGCRRRLQVIHGGIGNWALRIDEDDNIGTCRHQFSQQPKALWPQILGKIVYAGNVARGSIKAIDETKLYWIGADAEDDGNRAGRSLGRERCCRAARCGDDGHLALHKLGHQCRHAIELVLSPTIFDYNIAAIDETGFAEALTKCRGKMGACIGGAVMEKANYWHRRLLRARRARPRCRAAEQRDELAPLHSITSSARAISDGGTVRPSTRAAWALMTSSNLVDCTTGKSAGFAPLRMRPV